MFLRIPSLPLLMQIECPHCHSLIPADQNRCPRCRQNLPTLGDKIFGLRKKKWFKRFLLLVLFGGLAFLFVECRKALD